MCLNNSPSVPSPAPPPPPPPPAPPKPEVQEQSGPVVGDQREKAKRKRTSGRSGLSQLRNDLNVPGLSGNNTNGLGIPR